jgi:hypothetical protein
VCKYGQASAPAAKRYVGPKIMIEDADPEIDFQAYVQNMPFDVLLGLEKEIDRSRFPDRHRMVTDLIEKHRKNNTIQYSQSHLDNLRYPEGVRFIRSVNVFMLCATVVGIVFKTANGSLSINTQTVFVITANLLFSSLVVYGLFREKSWVVVMVLLSSYFRILQAFIEYYTDQGAPMDRVLHSGVLMAFLLFYAFQIVVFSRKETRAFYKEKGMVLVHY